MKPNLRAVFQVLVLVPANLSAKRTKVGELIDTDHDVSGTVYIVNQDTIMIDRFSFDNNGFGVYINVATEGANKKAWARNRIDVPYPSGSEGEPIDQEYTGSKADKLIINLKQVGDTCRACLHGDQCQSLEAPTDRQARQHWQQFMILRQKL